LGIFIQIRADNKRLTQDVKGKLVRVCPVDIFVLEGDQLVINPDNEDECTLCML
jgi:ferredoxin-like protein FixX